MASFQTYQTVQAYEDGLARHGQYVRWTRSVLCPCLNPHTAQADISCTLCKGRGRIHKTPLPMQVLYENVKHNNLGQLYPKLTPVVSGTVQVIRKGVELVLAGAQPSDGSYVQLDPPYPKSYEQVFMTYEYNPEVAVVDENSDVIGTNTLRTIASRFEYRGKTFEGSIAKVTKVYNATKVEIYTVSRYEKEYIYLSGMGTWASGDVLEVSYKYVRPFNFILAGISPKVRYERPYVLDQAELTLITPYYAKPAPDDLFTALSNEKIGSAILDPTATAGNDVVGNYYDLSRILAVIDRNGTEYDVSTSVQLVGRNEIKWLVSKPAVKYTIQFTYHPTYVAFPSAPTLRTAENKEFVNKTNLVIYDKVNEVTF